MPYYPPRADQNPPEETPTPPAGQEQEDPEKVHRVPLLTRNQRILRLVLAVLSVALLLYGGIRLISYGLDLISARNTRNELIQAAEEASDAENDPARAGTEGQEPALGTEPGLTAGIGTDGQAENAAETDGSDGQNLAGSAGGTEQPGTEKTGTQQTGTEKAGTQQTEAGKTEPASAAAAGQSLSTENTGAVSAPEKLPVVEYPKGNKMVESIRKMKQKSSYVEGRLQMFDLDEPVAFKDNSFFLDHDAMGNRNVNGALFLDENTRLLTRPYTLIIYGHNMKTGAMFGNLRKYKNSAFCNAHRMIQFDTMFEEGTYAIFSVGEISLIPNTPRYVNLNRLQSSVRKERREALNALMKTSDIGVVLDVKEDDQLLLLITCVASDDERLVVAARRLREGESEKTLVFRQ